MNKRGQFFILVAIIIALSLFSVIVIHNKITEHARLEDYEDLTRNFESEVPKVISDAKYRDLDVNDRLREFSGDFLDSARQSDPNFGLIFIVKDSDGTIHIVNSLDNREIEITVLEGSGDELEFSLLSSNEETTGQICIRGLGCSTHTAQVSTFSNAFSESELRDIKRLCIGIKDSDVPCVSVRIEDLTVQTWAHEEDTFEITNDQGVPVEGNTVAIKINNF